MSTADIPPTPHQVLQLPTARPAEAASTQTRNNQLIMNTLDKEGMVLYCLEIL